MSVQYKATDGTIYSSPDEAVDEFCKGKSCETCPLGKAIDEEDISCTDWATENPKEAAKLVGLEIIQEGPIKYRCPGGKEFATMWEASRYICTHRTCGGCQLWGLAHEEHVTAEDGNSCSAWAEQNPERAAKLMEIEIIQQTPEPDPTANPAQEAADNPSEEEPMATYECKNCGGETEAHQPIFCPWCGLRFDEADMKKAEIAAPNVRRHWNLCWELNELYERKNHDYGDSFHQSFEEEGMAMARIRLGDKLSRFKTLTRNGGQQVTDESIRDTLIDLANYAIMTVMEMEEQR